MTPATAPAPEPRAWLVVEALLFAVTLALAAWTLAPLLTGGSVAHSGAQPKAALVSGGLALVVGGALLRRRSTRAGRILQLLGAACSAAVLALA